MYEETDVRVILLSRTINISALVWTGAQISHSHTHTHTHTHKTCMHTHTHTHTHTRQYFLLFLHVSSLFRPRRRRGRHFNCSSEEMASFHLDGHIMNIFHFELSFTYRVSQLFSLWTFFFFPSWHFPLWFCQDDLHTKFVPLFKEIGYIFCWFLLFFFFLKALISIKGTQTGLQCSMKHKQYANHTCFNYPSIIH